MPFRASGDQLPPDGGRPDTEGDAATAAGSILADELALLRALINQIPEQLYVKDRQSRFIVANEAVARDKVILATGAPVVAADLIGKSDFDVFPPHIAQGFRDIEAEIMRSGVPMLDMLELNVAADGTEKWIQKTKAPLRDSTGAVVGLIGIGHDITARKRAEERVQFLAHHDPLTGLPNRSLLIDRMNQAILASQRSSQSLVVVFADIDNFKMINDNFGHDAGDTVLKAVADRMILSVRKTDTVVRLGGDEIIILLSGHAADKTAISTTVDKIRNAVSEPLAVAGETLRVTTSMGVATFPHDGNSAEALLRNADIAMYQAKAFGRDRVQFFLSAIRS